MANAQQPSLERGQHGMGRLHPNYQGAQQLGQQGNFQGPQTLQSLRNLGVMQGGNPLEGGPQQAGFTGQATASQLAQFQRSSSQQSLLQMASANQLSSYQAQVCSYNAMPCRVLCAEGDLLLFLFLI